MALPATVASYRGPCTKTCLLGDSKLPSFSTRSCQRSLSCSILPSTFWACSTARIALPVWSSSALFNSSFVAPSLEKHSNNRFHDSKTLGDVVALSPAPLVSVAEYVPGIGCSIKKVRFIHYQ